MRSISKAFHPKAIRNDGACREFVAHCPREKLERRVLEHDSAAVSFCSAERDDARSLRHRHVSGGNDTDATRPMRVLPPPEGR
jgi:hypothetical protein